MRSALLCASSAERIFIISRLSRSAERSKRIFTGGVGTNSLSQSLTALTAPSGREPLARPDFSLKLYRHAKGPISEGAVAVGDWGSSPTEKGCPPIGRQPFPEENKENTRPKGQSEYQNILSSL